MLLAALKFAHSIVFLQRRVILIIVVQSLGLLDALCQLEAKVGDAVASQTVYTWPWNWSKLTGLPPHHP